MSPSKMGAAAPVTTRLPSGARTNHSVSWRGSFRREPVDRRRGEGDEEDARDYHRVTDPAACPGGVELDAHAGDHRTEREAQPPGDTQREHPRDASGNPVGWPWLVRVVSDWPWWQVRADRTTLM